MFHLCIHEKNYIKLPENLKSKLEESCFVLIHFFEDEEESEENPTFKFNLRLRTDQKNFDKKLLAFNEIAKTMTGKMIIEKLLSFIK
jgi:hypothetical protein